MPRTSQTEQQALIRLIQIATVLSGGELPSATHVLATLRECNSLELRLAPRTAEPGLDSTLILEYQLKGLQS